MFGSWSRYCPVAQHAAQESVNFNDPSLNCPRCHRNNLTKSEKSNDSVLCNRCNSDLTTRPERQRIRSKMNQKTITPDVASRMMQDIFQPEKYESFMNQNISQDDTSRAKSNYKLPPGVVSMMCQNSFRKKSYYAVSRMCQDMFDGNN